MSGIVGSRLNIRGSGLVGSLGTDGQVFTSSGTGTGHVFEDAAGGAWNLISTFTSDGSDATASITSGLDSTYDLYALHHINIEPASNGSGYSFQGSIDGGSNYNVSMQTSTFRSVHDEANDTVLQYVTSLDQVNGTSFQDFGVSVGDDGDQSVSALMYLYTPSSTTFTKFFQSRIIVHHSDNGVFSYYIDGYFNTTSAINALQWKFSAGDITSGKIKLYGIS